MIHPASADRLTADEKHEVHNARVIEFESGAISGKEFVFSLVNQCGFSEMEAKREWQQIRDLGNVEIYKKNCGDVVYYQRPHVPEWEAARVLNFYAQSVGVVVDIGNGLQVPFSLFELRAMK